MSELTVTYLRDSGTTEGMGQAHDADGQGAKQVEPWEPPLSHEAFLVWAEREVRRLQSKYLLHEWHIALEVIPD